MFEVLYYKKLLSKLIKVRNGIIPEMVRENQVYGEAIMK